MAPETVQTVGVVVVKVTGSPELAVASRLSVDAEPPSRSLGN
jgi:hypothetical protein